MMCIAVAILLCHFPECGPAAYVVPGHRDGQHRSVSSLLHNGVVNRVGRARFESGPVQADEVLIATRAIERGATGFEHLGLVLAELGEEARGAEQEHTAIPVVLAGCDILFRS